MKTRRLLETQEPPCFVLNGSGPAGIRTLDTRIKSPMLCQAELQARKTRVAKALDASDGPTRPSQFEKVALQNITDIRLNWKASEMQGNSI